MNCFVNEHGVIEGGDMIKLSNHTKPKAIAILEIGEDHGRYFFGVHVQYGSAQLGAGGFGFAPSIDKIYIQRPKGRDIQTGNFIEKDEALRIGKKYIKDRLSEYLTGWKGSISDSVKESIRQIIEDVGDPMPVQLNLFDKRRIIYDRKI